MNVRFSYAALVVTLLFGGALFLDTVAEARGPGGGGPGGRGGKSFSRKSPARGGSFRSRSAKKARREALRRHEQRKRHYQELQERQNEIADRQPYEPDSELSDRLEDRLQEGQDRHDKFRDDRKGPHEKAGREHERRKDRLEEAHEEKEKRRKRHDEAWDDHGYSGGYWIYWDGEETTYVDRAPCDETVWVDGDTYYRCDAGWYIRSHAGGDVIYVSVSPPPGY